MVCLFTHILVIFISQNGRNIYFSKHPFSFQHIQNGQFSYSKMSFQFFFYLTKYYFNLKSNHFKCFHPNTHFHSNTFKIVNSFCPFQMGMGKMATMVINNYQNIPSFTFDYWQDYPQKFRECHPLFSPLLPLIFSFYLPLFSQFLANFTHLCIHSYEFSVIAWSISSKKNQFKNIEAI